MTAAELVARQRRNIRRFAVGTSKKRMRAFYERAAADLEKRIRALLVSGRDFEARHMLAVQREVRGTLAEMADDMASVLSRIGHEGLITSAAANIDIAKKFTIQAGATPRFAIESAGILEGLVADVDSSLLIRYKNLGRSSWASSTIKRMEGEMSLAVAEGIGNDAAATRLMKNGFMKERYRADRIARTEASYATNTGALLSGKSMARDMPGLKKKWIAALDNRNSEECKMLHGTTKPYGEEFVDPLGKHASIQNPPIHPHCRCTIIPFHPEWEPIKSIEPVEEAA